MDMEGKQFKIKFGQKITGFMHQISKMKGIHRCTRTYLLDVNRGDDGVHGVLNVVVHQVLILIKCFNEFIVFEIIYQLN